MARQYAIGGPLGAGYVIDAEDRNFSLVQAYVAVAPAAGGGVTATVTGNSVTASVGTPTVATVASISTTLTGNQIAVATNDVTAIGRIPVTASVTTNLATVAVDTVTVAAKANASTTTNLATTAVGDITIVGKANSSVTTNLATVSVGDVTVLTPAGTRPTYGSLAKVAYGARTNVTQAVPASTVDGDLLIWCVVTGNASPITPAFPAGWTQIGSTQTGSDAGGFDWVAITGWRLASSEPADYTATHAACSSESLMVRVDNPASEILSVDAFSQSQYTILNSDSIATSISPTESDDLLLFIGLNWDIQALAPPTGMTERQDSSFLYLATEDLAASGATGTRTQTHNTSPWFANLYAVKAAAGGAGAAVDVTGQQLTAFVGTVTPTGKATVLTTTNLATTAVGDGAAVGKANASVITNLATIAVGDVSVTAKRAVSVMLADQQVTIAVGTATATAQVGVSTLVSGQQIAISVGAVTIDARQATSILVGGQEIAISGTGVSVSAGGSVATGVSGQELPVSVNDVTVTAKQAVATTIGGQQAVVSVEPVTVLVGEAGTAAVTGQQIAIQCGSVSVSLGAVWEWDPSTLTGTGTLTHNGMTLTATGPASIQSIVSHDDGLFYAETTFSGDDPVGLWGLFNQVANTGTMIVLESGDVVSEPSGTLIPTFAPIEDGDTAGLAYEAASGTVWFRVNGGAWNNDWAQSPDSTGVGLWEPPSDVGHSGTLTLFTGDHNITAADTLLEDLDIPMRLNITGANVTLRNCLISSPDFYGIYTDETTTGLTVDHCTIAGIGGTFAILTGNNFSVTHCEMYGFENGIGAQSDGVIANNYIHDLGGSEGAHIDGIQFAGFNYNVTISDNWIEAWDTSCIIVKADYGPIDNIVIENNTLINKPGELTAYPVYAVSVGTNIVSNVILRRNRLQQGAFGYLSAQDCSPEASFNIDYDSGQRILQAYEGFPVQGQQLTVHQGLAYVMPIEPPGYDAQVSSGIVGIVGPATAEPTLRSANLSSYAYVSDAYVIKPADVEADDLLIVALFRAKTATMSPPVPFSPGWTQLGAYQEFSFAGFNGELSVWWKRAGASEPDEYLWAYFQEAYTQTWVAAYSGCHAIGPIQSFSQNGGQSGTATGLGLDLIQLNSKLIFIGTTWEGSGTLTPPTGMTERADHVLYVADETIAGYGLTGNRSQTLAGNFAWTTFLVGLMGA